MKTPNVSEMYWFFLKNAGLEIARVRGRGSEISPLLSHFRSLALALSSLVFFKTSKFQTRFRIHFLVNSLYVKRIVIILIFQIYYTITNKLMKRIKWLISAEFQAIWVFMVTTKQVWLQTLQFSSKKRNSKFLLQI